MITFREILDGRILYHDISALYGPFYYSIITPLFSLLDVPLSHDAARLVSAAFWFCCTVSLAALVWRLTCSAIAALFAGLIALFFLKLFVHSPLHPQELSFLLICLLLHLLVSVEKEPKPIALTLMGGVVGGLLLIKINLAAFVTLPLILGALRATSDRGSFRAIEAVVLALGLLLPIALMGPLFRLEWVIWYCVFAERNNPCCAFGLVVQRHPKDSDDQTLGIFRGRFRGGGPFNALRHNRSRNDSI